MKVRVLVEQRAIGDRRYLPSGEVADVPNDWARELLDRGDAEPIAEKPAERASKRVVKPRESR